MLPVPKDVGISPIESEAEPKPTPRTFVAEAGKDWVSVVAGFIGVVLSVAGLFLDQGAYRLLWLAAAFVAYVFSAYRLWGGERNHRIELQNTLNALIRSKRPQLVVSIDQWWTADGEDGLFVFLNVSVGNMGAPSIADSWNVAVFGEGQGQLQSQKVLIGDDKIGTGSAIRTLTLDDWIERKTLKERIPTGGRVRGWLKILIPGHSFSENLILPGNNSSFRVCCLDYLGNLSSAEHDNQASLPSEGPKYFPE